MHVQVHINDYTMILQAIVKLQKENTALKSKLEAGKLHVLTNDVANRINHWMNVPYRDVSERQDIENFAKEITKYIDSQLRT
ncbi:MULTISPECIES: hypothetical protein [unclassified Sporosarcina]|uniref:hypothetical protein n=1 Tax=unclassified Sporosarcina TaxID=2647733 RepID=UPI0020407C1C|nr:MULTISPECIES: hypothetical protein [unclassified Sporosarcina]GKV66720.1 hypothetical protein NCCP2331_28730 [Sporosarcina sp. NCCP-2331]GLB57097.1 hypothetical protein NCCP2378_28840 [Sporosarcina sp. NCCP-2378]